ncbi:ADP-ribosylglycohydrolase family protein [Candidatus Saccharibacteria bacterium]|nr:ADP-ribosylglycohydrolase family protein [Candidatus Saccharibacteria bacterium]
MAILKSPSKIADRIRGSLIGGAVGDALGYQIEFETGIKPKQVTKYRNDRGIISDDTQMTLFTACALLWRETRWANRGIAMLPPEAVYLGFLDWLGTQQRAPEHHSVSWISGIPELNCLRDPGMTCINALSSGKAGNLGEPINNSKGCGGIMRIAPIGLFISPEDKVGEFSSLTCALTHGHPLAILSAYTLGLIIYYTVNDWAIEKAAKTAISKMNEWQPEAYRNSRPVKINWDEEKSELTELLEKAISLSEEELEDIYAISELGGGWVAEEALAISIYCSLKYKDNFKDAIIAAVNHDGDSDSTGAITGNIVGAKVGYKNIPDYYKNNIELKDVILELADDLASGVPVNEDGDITDKNWLKKYLI